MKLFKFNQNGFSHLIMPLVIVAIVAVIGGTVYVNESKAATLTGCVASTYQSGSTGTCVQYIQQIINGIGNYAVLTKEGSTSINKEPVSDQDSPFGNGTFGAVTDSYTSTVVTVVKGIQSWVNANGTLPDGGGSFNFGLSASAFAAAFKPNGALSTAGVTDKNTWYAECEAITKIPSSDYAVTDSTDYVGGKTTGAKTSMWYVRSYMCTAVTAANYSNCSGLLNSNGTTTASGVPAAPTSVSVAMSATAAVLKWSPPSGATNGTFDIVALNGTKVVTNTTHNGLAFSVRSGTYDKGTVAQGDTAEVRYCNTSGKCSAWVNKAIGAFTSTTSTKTPVAPTGVTASTTSGNLVVNWNKVTNTTVVKYEVVPLTSSGATISVPNNYVTVTSATFDKSTITKVATSGSVEVRACSSSTTDPCGAWGTAKFSFASSSTTTSVTPVAPTGVTASTTSGNLVVNWNKVTNTTVVKYEVVPLTSSGATISVPNNYVTVTSATFDKSTITKVATSGSVEVRACSSSTTDPCGAWGTAKFSF